MDMVGFNYDLIQKYKLTPQDWHGREYKRFMEWEWLDSYIEKRKMRCATPNNPPLSYYICKTDSFGIPTEYEIWFSCKSIIGIKDNEMPRKPIYGYLHKMRIILPHNYPAADGNPLFIFITDIWHPNIRHSGSFKGRVCLTIKEMGVLTSLKDLVILVEQYLKYQIYNAQNTYPFPEDKDVAKWVREEGEPNGWVKSIQFETIDQNI